MSTRRERAFARAAGAVAAMALMLLAGCAGGAAERADTIAGVTSGAAVQADAGDDAEEEEVQRADAQDADHEFLRQLIDHHDAMAGLGREAMSRASAARTRAAAHRLHTALEARRDSLRTLVRSIYGETVEPQHTADARAAAERVRALEGPAYDRAFYDAAIAHQRAGARLAADRLPQLTRAEVQRLARKTAEEHRQRAEELEQSASAR